MSNGQRDALTAELLETVKNLVALAEHRARLDEYAEALRLARVVIAKAEAQS